MLLSSPILGIDDVSLSFGELRVLSNVSFNLTPGETLGLIGPNGAGKTTLFNVVTGFLRPDRGRVIFRGQDLAGRDPASRVHAGLVRSFQKSMVFPALETRENISLAVRARHGTGFSWWNRAKHVRAADAEAEGILERAGLSRFADDPVGSLSYGEQRMVDILISIAMRPILLLLDEPTAGLAREESDRLLSLVRYHDENTSVVLIAHDLDVVFSICDRIAVLDLGHLVAIDTPAAIRAHEGVQKAYLGEKREHSA
jgi:branched-chain amino acid transport system ATP-binding protein